MPRHYQLKQWIAEFNKLWNIFPTPNNTCGLSPTTTWGTATILPGAVGMYTAYAKTLHLNNNVIRWQWLNINSSFL